MASYDLEPDGSALPRSLSEQLRLLERQLNKLSDSGPVHLVHPQPQAQRQPMSLGRPLGLAPPHRTPLLGVPERYDDDTEEGPAPKRRGTFRRRAVIGGISLLLLSSTAVIPSFLWPSAVPEAPDPEPLAAASLRTEQFAHAARELGQARLIQPAAPESVSPADASPPSPPAAAPAPGPTPADSPAPGEDHARAGEGARTTLTVAESELSRLSLPMLVSGGGPAWAGSAVIIDGLPADARVSHGMRIAPDTWTVKIDDVGQAVLSLPPTTPDRLELSVRVLAANSHELAASALQLHVVRGQGAPAQIAPAAIFEPAAAEAATGPLPEIEPVSRQAVKVERPKRPARPAKPPVTQQAKQPEQPKATSAWVSTVQPSAPAAGFAPAPPWSPFTDR
ncbi:MAG: hypothetical protein ACK4TL_13245 [Hyphomicrobiaceae bacterium]